MGAWGVHSYDNDSCHDILDRLHSKDKDNPEVKMIEHLLTNYCSTMGWDTPREHYLGIVVWGLHHNTIVARKRLQHALRCARYLINDAEYMETWRHPAMRKLCIQREIEQIQKWLRLSPKEFKVQKAIGSI